MGLNMMSGLMRKSWHMELRSYGSNIRLLMGYSDVVVVRVMLMFWALVCSYWASRSCYPLIVSVGCTA